MKNFSPVISFLALFFTIVCILDLTLPNRGEKIHIVKSENDKFIEVTKENYSMVISPYNSGQIVWRESTRILNQPMRYYSIYKNNIKVTKTMFNFYIPGIVFIVFLAIGGVYGVFFKKSEEQERRVSYYNLVVGIFLFTLYLSTMNTIV